MIGKTPLQLAQKEAMELLDFLGLAQRANHKPAMLSGGEQHANLFRLAVVNP